MVKFLKILIEKLKPKQNTIVSSEVKNKELAELLNDISYEKKLDEILDSPISSMCIVNVYYNSFNDLLTNLTRPPRSTTLIAVNFKSYFKQNTLTFTETIRRIIPIIESNKISVTGVHDLYEVIDTLKYLADLEGEEYGK